MLGPVTTIPVGYGLMQDCQLLTSTILSHASRCHGRRAIVDHSSGAMERTDYAALNSHVRRLASWLRRYGICPGDRVATLAWNTTRHLQLFYAVTGIGAVLHTVNPRLHDDQIAYILAHGSARLLFADTDLAPLARRIAERVGGVTVIELGAGFGASHDEPAIDWPVFDERAAAVLCYTSGTTGDPKGVLYSHRSIVLHAMATSTNATFGFDAADVILPCASMFHACAWGLPFVAPMNGVKLVLPGRVLDAVTILRLIHDEGVTIGFAVPTIWSGVLAEAERTGRDLGSLRRVIIGGSAVSQSTIDRFATYGVDVRQCWGMTEMSPMGTISCDSPALDGLPDDARRTHIATSQGRTPFGVEIALLDDRDARVPEDGVTPGRLVTRGPWVVSGYYRADGDALDADGWFDTGDVATIDSYGYLRITDRAKDVIKSGGEWISSVELENEAAGCAGVRVAATIGISHPKWEERPLLVIEPHDGATVDQDEVMAALRAKFARWWIPDAIVLIDEVPLTSVGKIDKKRLRARFSDHYAAADA